MKRAIALTILLAGISVMGHTHAEMPVAYTVDSVNPFAGKSGRGLVAAIRKECRPQTYPGHTALSHIFYDTFTGADIAIVDGKLPDGYIASQLVSPAWWKEIDIYADTLSLDLNNFLPLLSDVSRLRSDLPPGHLSEVTSTFDHWSLGRGYIYSTLADMYEPPVKLRGPLARAIFYMAVMYPHYIFSPRGSMILHTDYPYLTPYAKDLLMRWSSENPPGDDEIAWMHTVTAEQGACNPFVHTPELAGYIWGENEGDIYIEEDKPVPLHSTYTLEHDMIYLMSPHIPSDAVWTIDGYAVTYTVCNASELGAGLHHLTYTSQSTGESGMLMINIMSNQKR